MKMRHSESLLLIWRIAEFEARQLKASTLEPHHLLLGLCKSVDLDLPALVSKKAPDRHEILEEFLREIRRLREIFRASAFDARVFRRGLRKVSAGNRFSTTESARLRRSPSTRQIFAHAERFAQLGSSEVYPVHLFYATLLAEDKTRDAMLTELSVEKTRLLSFTKREVSTPQLGSESASMKARTRWN
jgi:hypothetical protein